MNVVEIRRDVLVKDLEDEATEALAALTEAHARAVRQCAKISELAVEVRGREIRLTAAVERARSALELDRCRHALRQARTMERQAGDRVAVCAEKALQAAEQRAAAEAQASAWAEAQEEAEAEVCAAERRLLEARQKLERVKAAGQKAADWSGARAAEETARGLVTQALAFLQERRAARRELEEQMRAIRARIPHRDGVPRSSPSGKSAAFVRRLRPKLADAGLSLAALVALALAGVAGLAHSMSQTTTVPRTEANAPKLRVIGTVAAEVNDAQRAARRAKLPARKRVQVTLPAHPAVVRPALRLPHVALAARQPREVATAPLQPREVAIAPLHPREVATAALRLHVATPRVQDVTPPNILLFSLLPRKVQAGEAATLCISAAHAKTVFVSGMGTFNPRLTTCRTFVPKNTTNFVAYAVNARGKRTQRNISVVVRPSITF